MAVFYRTVVTQVGPDVGDLIDGGMLILFAEGAPPELAEVSVLHRVSDGPSPAAPPVGAEIVIGPVAAQLTAIGALAWNKIGDMGHVVINFDGAPAAGRPGELNASPVAAEALSAALKPGAMITISA